MNWSTIALQVVALIGVASFTMALLYYVRYGHSKALAQSKLLAESNESDGGEFLKRYVPPEHRQSEPLAPVKPLIASRTLFYATCMLIPAMVLGMTALSYYTNRTIFLEDIVLTETDKQALGAVAHTFDAPLNPYAPNLPRVFQALDSNRNFVVMMPRQGSTYEADSWVALLESARAPVSRCSFGATNACPIHSDTTVILPLADDLGDITPVLLQVGVSVIAYGFPRTTGVWQGIEFLSESDTTIDHLAVVGDRELSLGIAAGTNFPIERLQEGFRVESSSAQAVTQFSDQIAGGDTQTRLFAKSTGLARLVWMDFSVAAGQQLRGESRIGFDALLANIIRYAGEQEYQSIATWPEGRTHAAFLEQDTEDGYEASKVVASRLSDLDMPVTWYVLSDLANEQRDLTVQLASVGEMACHGDNHDIMTRYTLAEQVERLARCIKVVEAITGERPVGFRPPTEAFNADTLSALLNVGMTYFFAENSTETQVPHIKTSRLSGESFVSIPRVVTDDYYLWHFLKLNGDASLKRARDELKWVQAVGSLYGFSFHSQFMENSEHLGVVEALARDLKADSDVYLSTNGELAKWWKVRHALMRGESVEQSLLDKFGPVTLRVDGDGRLVRATWQGRNKALDENTESTSLAAAED